MKSINSNAPVKCSQSILIHATAEKIWPVLTGISEWPSWQTAISGAVPEGPVAVNTSFTWKTGGAKIRSTLHTVEPFSYFGWTGKTFGMFAIHNWTLQEKNGATTVTVDESMEGLLAGLFKKSFNRNLEKGMKEWLELLKQESEK